MEKQKEDLDKTQEKEEYSNLLKDKKEVNESWLYRINRYERRLTNLPLYIISLFLVFALIFSFSANERWFLLFLGLALIITTPLYLFSKFQTSKFAFKCSNCGNTFDISPFMYIKSNEILSWKRGGPSKYLKCPGCGKFAHCSYLKKEDFLYHNNPRF